VISRYRKDLNEVVGYFAKHLSMTHIRLDSVQYI